MVSTKYDDNEETKVLLLKTQIKHLENDLRLTKEEYETSTEKYFDIYTNMEKKVADRTKKLQELQKILEAKNKELQESEQRYRSVFEHTGTATVIFDDNYVIIMCNSEYEELSGYSKNEIENKMKLSQFVSDKNLECMVKNNCDMSCHIGNSPLKHESELSDKDGNKKYVHIKIGVIPGTKMRIASITDITERKRAEEALRVSEERYRMLFNSGNDSIYVHELCDQSSQCKFIEVNDVACERLNYTREEFLQLSPVDICAPKNNRDDSALMEKLINDKHLLYEKVHITKYGDRIPVEINAHLIEIKDQLAVLSIARDITERKRMEEEIQKSQKLESIGLLAGGIAHDFNNRLTIILGNAQLAQLMFEKGNDITKYLQKIEDGAQQATTLTQQLLTFSKGGQPVKKVCSIADLIVETAHLSLSGSNERCVFDIPDDLWAVEIDKGQFSQVLNNLVINADQAMPDGGVIKISAKNISDPEDLHCSLKPGKYIRITTQDQGIGIPPEKLTKIFDPYFTTKQKGSGLGLAVAYSIIEKHDGLITVESKLGVGTTFMIYLPAVDTKVEEEIKHSEKSFRGSAKVLVMDDEEPVLEMMEDMLTGDGYEVGLAKDGYEAVSLFQQAQNSGKPYNALIMDLTIPGGMGGKDTINRLRRIDPKVRAIVSSGYSNDPIMSNYDEYGFCGVITKPYDINELKKILYEVMNRDT